MYYYIYIQFKGLRLCREGCPLLQGAIINIRRLFPPPYTHTQAVGRVGLLCVIEMEQESRVENEETASRQPPEGPVLCVNNCGFFGNATTMNLCSQCYRNVVMKQAKAAESIASTSSKQNIPEEPQPIQPVLVTEVKIKSGNELLSSSSPSVPPTPNRCFTCNKRVGLTGFKCKCGNQFCGLHRYTDKHNCSFDYRAAGREAISKANPIVKAEKIDKI